jgi:ATP-dependent DNA helicase RecQ
MKPIVFIDTEVSQATRVVHDIGAVGAGGEQLHTSSVAQLGEFLQGAVYLCGHNIIHHDLQYIGKAIQAAGIDAARAIDTLFLSPLLFPQKPYHALLKDDRILTEELNNPLNDALKARELFLDEVEAFNRLQPGIRDIYRGLLFHVHEFYAFFHYMGLEQFEGNVEGLIREVFHDQMCHEAALDNLITERPVELAYCLALMGTGNHYSITPPWVLKNYPDVERIMLLLRNRPCLPGCSYCNRALDARGGLRRYFGYSSYRTFAGEPLQEEAVKAAVAGKSILAVFPTGGGKSITFQVPALMAGESARALTVVISPLQSLMKDQVDNLEKQGVTQAVTINGLLDPIERAKSFERVEDGSASLLYISPESLRSPSIGRLLLGRKIARFVIDEAHCFSSWGQDFRVDYLYIGDFIRSLQDKKMLADPIPISCFTATAKQNVIYDICEYFWSKLSLRLEIFSSKSSRSNLSYRVFQRESDEEKYTLVRDLLEEKNCPTIIYVSRTRKAFDLARRLTDDGYTALPYHGKMDNQQKTANQNAFMDGEVDIMVATSAFGMGVDKKDVGMVIHFEISDSLENYIQEAGRAGRDETISADCYVLFNEEDLSKHFILLNQTRLSIKEIQQVWKAIKGITRLRSTVSNSALEIARKAGWDDNVVEIETRVTTAIAALEDAGYLKRGQNMPRIFANSILCRSAQEAIDRINASDRFVEKQKEQAIRIIKKLFSSKNRKSTSDEVAESRVDYISDHLGIVKEEVIRIINLLRDENILADRKDLTAFIRKGEAVNRPLAVLEAFSKIENYLSRLFADEEKTFNLKEINEQAQLEATPACTPNKVKTIINLWAIKNWIRRGNYDQASHHVRVVRLPSRTELQEKLQKRHELARFILGLLFMKSQAGAIEKASSDEVLVEFSVHELRDEYLNSPTLFRMTVDAADVEDALFYLSRIGAIKIEGGFMVVYNKLSIERLEQDNRRKYKLEDYQRLNGFYENRIQQIHIVGEYARKMIDDYRDALQFVEDYFQLNYSSFLGKYFKGSRKNDISRNITPKKFRQLFGELSPAQLRIINDKESPHIVVAAGPGSGKTRVLVHKLAAMLLMEDVKHEQLLMLTFSRAAATGFKKRLIELIGGAAQYVSIKTFHGFCFDLLGKMGTLEKADGIIKQAIEKIRKGEVEPSQITKMVLVIDEAQDMNADEYELVRCLMEANEEMRVIAVGDDDQNIFEFRGASSQNMEDLIIAHHATRHELLENFRSKGNLVDFTNQFATSIRHRLKKTPVVARDMTDGKIRLVRYQSANLIEPMVDDMGSIGRAGTGCVLTSTNEEALQVNGLLLKKGVPAKLIQSNDGFNLYNLYEIRCFLDLISPTADGSVIRISNDQWEESLRRWKQSLAASNKLESCLRLLNDFHAIHPKVKYLSDLEVFVRESRLEDFIAEYGDCILVSTMHKAKGKEFDEVYLMLDNFYLSSEEKKRQLYVAMTRAKRNLTIYLNHNYLDPIHATQLTREENEESFGAPSDLLIQLSFKDVWLDYFMGRQHQVLKLHSGEALKPDAEGCLSFGGHGVVRFSRQFTAQMEELKTRGFAPVSAKIGFMVYWKKEGVDDEVLVVLPEILFQRMVNQ